MLDHSPDRTLSARATLAFAGLLAMACICCPRAAEKGAHGMRIHSRKTLSTRGSTRGTAYAMSNKIISTDTTVYVAWLDHVADIRMATFDRKTEAWSEVIAVGKGVDNHSGPAMSMDSAGYLYIVFGPHVGPFQFRRSVRPFDATEWAPVEHFGVNGTYPSLVCGPDDTLHCTYRGGQKPLRLMYQRRPQGEAWSEPRELVNADVPSGYTQYGNPLAIAADNTLHLAFHIYDHHPAGGKAWGYLRSRDGGHTWENAAGEPLALPVTPATSCMVEKDASYDMRVSNIALDPDGHPFVVAVHLKPNPKSAKLWHHDGQSWRHVDLLPAVRTTYPKLELAWCGTVAFDRSGRLYIATVVQRPPGGWGHASQDVVLLTSDDRGETFAVTPVSEPDPTRPCWLPSLERPSTPDPVGLPSLIYTHGGPGIGCNEGDATEIVFVRLAE